ncbi:MAG: hypothetical protein J6B01_04415 [Ruminococcus sp.]|nr:hypothetical protein [Ruminococcus sp.]
MAENEVLHDMVSVGCNKFTVDSEEIWVSFYNEDEHGNEHDTTSVKITKHCAESLIIMLKDTIKPV